MTKQMTIVVIGSLRVKFDFMHFVSIKKKLSGTTNSVEPALTAPSGAV